MKRRTDLKARPEQTKIQGTESESEGREAADAVGAAAAEDDARRRAKQREREDQAEKDPSKLTMGPGYERIISRQFNVADRTKELEEYELLRNALSFRDRASTKSYGELIDALDKAEVFAHRGAELAARAKMARDSMEFDAKTIAGGLKRSAMQAINERRKQLKEETGSVGKAISNDDVEKEIASLFPDQWAELETRRETARRNVGLLEDLAVRLGERAKDLRQMVARARTAE